MFDYIVVGAGSAGCVVAARLSDNPATTVRLIEAGGSDERPEIQIPLRATRLFRSDVDWAYDTEPQAALGGRRVFWPRGKVLGGTSALNSMVYIRGHQASYDEWASLGNTGWSYADVLPLFKRMEHQERGADAYHGVDGPLNVADLRDPNPLSSVFLQAVTELGLPLTPDFNGAEQAGFGPYQVTQKNGERWSAASAYLRLCLSRPNLSIMTQAHVTRILLDGTRAVGVEVRQGEAIHQLQARREVIVCGGAINSPQLLLLSGIGPGEHLQAMGVPVHVDLPGVGQNLQDHLDVPVAYQCREPITFGIVHDGAEDEYRDFRMGPLTSNGPEAGGFVKTRPDIPMPDLQYHFCPGWTAGFGLDRPAGHGFALWPGLLLPASRGYLALQSPDPLAAPLIQPHYLACEADVEVLAYGVKLARRILHTRAFAPYLGDPIRPTDDVRSDDAICAFVRASASTIFHPVGTCKMGVDSLAVVDPQLRVYGVEGLRVADASIMPRIVNGNTNAPAMMIGEKLAELVGR